MEWITITTDRTSFEQPLPVFLNISHYDSSLTKRPSKLKEFMHNYMQSASDKEIFDLQKRHTAYMFSTYKISFLTKL